MGASFTNYQVRAQTTAEVKLALEKLVQSRAYVSPEKHGWVTVYDESTDSQDQSILLRIAGGLSKALDTSVLGFLVHDSDIAMYWLYNGGVLADEFNSAPDYFGDEVDDATRARVLGNPDALLPLCVSGTTRGQIEAVIHSSDELPLMAENILSELAPVLGIDEARISLGFESFDKEGEELLPDASEFEPLGKAAKRKKAETPRLEKEPSPASPTTDVFFLVGFAMLITGWSDEPQNVTGADAERFSFSQLFPYALGKEMAKKARTQWDRQARDYYKQSELPGKPSFEELKSARDQGPGALAELVAKCAPMQLGSIAMDAVNEGLENFLCALLACGLDPKATDHHGQSILAAAEKKGADSKIYQMLKSAADKNG